MIALIFLWCDSICGYTGGICGQQNNSSEINNCYVISSTIQGLKGYYYGGISGLNLASSKINNCFVTASTIKGTTSDNNIASCWRYSWYE
jgi:hypothetical protein